MQTSVLDNRGLKVIGWVLPSEVKRRSLSRSRSRSRSSSILYGQPGVRSSRERLKITTNTEEIQARTVSVLDGKKNLLLYIEVEPSPTVTKDRRVTLEVDWAVSGEEG